MLGRYKIKIHTAKVGYSFSIERKYNIICGDSATGKSELCRLLNENGVTVECDADIEVLSNGIKNWKKYIMAVDGSIFFIDEAFRGLSDIASGKVHLEDSDNYFVFITRRYLGKLPISIKSIYTFQKTGMSKTYTENCFVRRYVGSNPKIKPDLILTEDSNSGLEFFTKIFKDRCNCESAKGKSNVLNKLKEYQANYDDICAIVDGAAFGNEISRVLQFISVCNTNIVLAAPESFEWLLLQINELNADPDIITHTYNYCDLEKFREMFPKIEVSNYNFESWERFYKIYLIAITTGFNDRSYGKSSLKPYYFRRYKEVLKAFDCIVW